MNTSNTPFDRPFLSVSIIRHAVINSTHSGRLKLPIHESLNFLSDDELQGRHCFYCDEFVIVDDPNISEELRKQAKFSGQIIQVVYQLIGKTLNSSHYIGDFGFLKSAEVIAYRLNFEPGTYGICWQISADHLPSEVLEQAIEYAEQNHPGEYRGFGVELYPLPDHYDCGCCDSLCIRFVTHDWSIEQVLQERRQKFIDKGFDPIFIDLIILAGQAGLSILIIEANGKVMDGLKVYPN